MYVDKKIFLTLKLVRTKRIGPVGFAYLMDKHNGSLDAIITNINHIKLVEDAIVQEEIDNTLKSGARFILTQEINLTQYKDITPILVYKGDINLLKRETIGIVGPRKPSYVGEKFCTQITMELGKMDKVIVSGMAAGIDTMAHTYSMNTGTIAVLSGDINTIYPEKNSLLYESIAKNGLIITQQPIGTKLMAYHFPLRNKLIAALSDATIIIESTNKSGALNTAEHVVRYKKPLYAVPGHPYSPHYDGNNMLIKDKKAILFRNINDMEHEHVINEDLSIKIRKNDILCGISHTPIPIEDICNRYNCSINSIIALLGELVIEDQIIINNDMSVVLK